MRWRWTSLIVHVNLFIIISSTCYKPYCENIITISVGNTDVDHDGGDEQKEADEEDDEDPLCDDAAERAVRLVLKLFIPLSLTYQLHFLF